MKDIFEGVFLALIGLELVREVKHRIQDKLYDRKLNKTLDKIMSEDLYKPAIKKTTNRKTVPSKKA